MSRLKVSWIRKKGESMSAREQRIAEIMSENQIEYDIAESIFLDEICDKYSTDDCDIVESLFESDAEESEVEA